MNWIKVKNVLKKNPVTRRMYENIRSQIVSEQPQPGIDIPEIQSLEARRVILPENKTRVNILVPSLDIQHVFGGIATALSVFEKIGSYCGIMQRIIVTDGCVNQDTMVQLPHKYKVVECDRDAMANYQIVPFADRCGRTLPVAKNDYFLATAWWTAFTVENIIQWQSREYHCKMRPLIYLVQDYEPGFYPWSSRYLMADSTYRMEIPVFAIMNSKILFEYFRKNEYQFYRAMYFSPELNASLKDYLEKNYQRRKPRKKQVLIYGRPSVERNAFPLIVAALKRWVIMQDDIEEWSVIGAGEDFSMIDLGRGKQLQSIGKVSLEEYARIMLETKVGISLMVSPHPSYPPLEMAAFGVRVITNTYGNKDLGTFHSNIVSLSNCSIDNIAKSLCDICSKPDGEIDIDLDYVRQKNGQEWQDILEEINLTMKEKC